MDRYLKVVIVVLHLSEPWTAPLIHHWPRHGSWNSLTTTYHCGSNLSIIKNICLGNRNSTQLVNAAEFSKSVQDERDRSELYSLFPFVGINNKKIILLISSFPSSNKYFKYSKCDANRMVMNRERNGVSLLTRVDVDSVVLHRIIRSLVIRQAGCRC